MDYEQNNDNDELGRGNGEENEGGDEPATTTTSSFLVGEPSAEECDEISQDAQSNDPTSPAIHPSTSGGAMETELGGEETESWQQQGEEYSSRMADPQEEVECTPEEMEEPTGSGLEQVEQAEEETSMFSASYFTATGGSIVNSTAEEENESEAADMSTVGLTRELTGDAQLNKAFSAQESGSGADEGEVMSGDDEESTSPVGRKRAKVEKDVNKKEESVEIRQTGEGKAAANEGNKRFATLERLRNMQFSRRDPFNELSLSREGRTFRFSKGPRSPPSFTREGSNGRVPSTSVRAARSPPQHPGSSGNDSRESEQQQQLMESRRQRGMAAYLLKNEGPQQQQKHRQTGNTGPIGGGKPAQQPTIPLRQRIENLLSVPDEKVFAMPEQDLKTHMVHVVELFIEQERSLNEKKAQLIELDQTIRREREIIERLSMEMPPKFRPPPGMLDDTTAPINQTPPRPFIPASSFNNPPVLPQMLATQQSLTKAPPPSLPPPPAAFAVPPPIVPTSGVGATPPMNTSPQKTFSSETANTEATGTVASFTPITASRGGTLPMMMDTSVPPPNPNLSIAPPTQTGSPSQRHCSPPPPSASTMGVGSLLDVGATVGGATGEGGASQSGSRSFSSLPTLAKASMMTAVPVSATGTNTPAQYSAPPPPSNFSVPPPTAAGGGAASKPGVAGIPAATSSPASTSLIAAMDLSQPPPLSAVKAMTAPQAPPTVAALAVGTTSSNMPNLSIPPPSLHMPPPSAQKPSQPPSTAASVGVGAGGSGGFMPSEPPILGLVPPPNLAVQLATAPLSLLQQQQHQTVGVKGPPPLPPPQPSAMRVGPSQVPPPSGPPRPLMSIEQLPPPGFALRNLESIIQPTGSVGKKTGAASLLHGVQKKVIAKAAPASLIKAEAAKKIGAAMKKAGEVAVQEVQIKSDKGEGESAPDTGGLVPKLEQLDGVAPSSVSCEPASQGELSQQQHFPNEEGGKSLEQTQTESVTQMQGMESPSLINEAPVKMEEAQCPAIQRCEEVVEASALADEADGSAMDMPTN